MNIEHVKSSDAVDSLPTDQNSPSNADIQLVDMLFQEKQTLMKTVLDNTRDILCASFLFLLLSLPQADDLIKKYIQMTNSSPYILILVKAFIFAFLFFILKNFYLVQKKR